MRTHQIPSQFPVQPKHRAQHPAQWVKHKTLRLLPTVCRRPKRQTGRQTELKLVKTNTPVCGCGAQVLQVQPPAQTVEPGQAAGCTSSCSGSSSSYCSNSTNPQRSRYSMLFTLPVFNTRRRKQALISFYL